MYVVAYYIVFAIRNESTMVNSKKIQILYYFFHCNAWSNNLSHLTATCYAYHVSILKCYKNEHSFEICHWAWSLKLSCKILRRYDQPFSRKWRLKLLFLVIFRIFPNGNCHFRSGSWKADMTLWDCTSCRVTILVLFISAKLEAWRSVG